MPLSPHHRSIHSGQGRRQRGFALLITVTLLAFLVLLLVSLASLTRVETQVATNQQQLDQARQNALLALNIALGQLQKHAGPDQRITAPADLTASNRADGTAFPTAPATTSAVERGARYWTGAWGNGATRIGYDLRPDEIIGRGVTPLQLNWLVSGNEGVSFTTAANGRVSAPTAPRFTPDLAVTGLSAATTADTPLSFPVSDPVTGEASTPGVLLVGAGSASDGTPAGQIAGFTADHYVISPAVSIQAPANSLPGIPSATTVGRYAWWIGDEGVKARVNLQNGYQQLTSSEQSAAQINSFQVAQRSAPEFMDTDHAGTSLGFASTTGFDFTQAAVPKVLSPRQFAFANPAAAAQTALALTAKNRFHDLTTWSSGVLSDTYAGGLKKDLTADIADLSTAGNDAANRRPSDATPVFKPVQDSETILPTWGHLRSWARNAPGASGAFSPKPATQTQAGFAPMVMYASVGLDIFVDAAGTIRTAFYPVVLLSNPYPVDIAPARYDLGFRFQAGSVVDFRTAAARPINAGGPLTSEYSTVATLNLGTLAVSPPIIAPAVANGSEPIRFTIDSKNAIPAGETHIFLLAPSANEQPYAPGTLLERAPDVANGLPIGLLNRVYLPGTYTLDSSVKLQRNATTTPETTSTFLRAETRALSTVEIVLSEEGRLADRDHWYQSFNMIPGQGLRGGRLLLTKTIEDEEIAKFWRQDASEGARGVLLRMSTPMEGTGSFSSPGEFGLTGISRIWLRHGSMRALYTRPTQLENGPTVSAGERVGSAVMGLIICNDGTPAADKDPALIYRNDRYAVSMAGLPGSSPTRYSTLFDVLESPDRLLSLGQLQHVPFARFDFYPSLLFGNALANPRIDRTATWRDQLVVRPGTTATLDPIYDLAWHLNRALWDRTFVSAVPSAWSQADITAVKPLPNARLTYYPRDHTPPLIADLAYHSGTNRAYDRAAANLLVAGAFNINSTSEQAWRGILGGPRGQPANPAYAEAGDTVDQIIPYPRFSRNLSRTANGGPYAGISTTMNTSGTTRAVAYHGNRGLWLNDSQPGANSSPAAVVNELARTIVAEIRRCGPFLSLADFINRPILATKQDAGINGTLQRAIDTMDTAQVNPFTRFNTTLGGAINATASTIAGVYPGWDYEHYLGGPASEFSTTRAAFRFHSASAPKFLTQADLLSTLGPQLSARSDTFTIRAYGESLNPATGQREGRAWCEAVVQRTPGYVNPADAPENAPSAAENLRFGRKFQILSFRWLTPSEL